MLDLNQPFDEPYFKRALTHMQAKAWDEALRELQTGLKDAEKEKDKARQALLHTGFALLAKATDQNQEATRHYQKAEKLLPQQPSLKLITARHLTETFAQYEAALKRCDEVLAMSRVAPALTHQAQALKTQIYLKLGLRKEAQQALQEAMKNFAALKPSEIELRFLDAMAKKKILVELGQSYLEKAQARAAELKDEKYFKMFGALRFSLAETAKP